MAQGLTDDEIKRRNAQGASFSNATPLPSTTVVSGGEGPRLAPNSVKTAPAQPVTNDTMGKGRVSGMDFAGTKGDYDRFAEPIPKLGPKTAVPAMAAQTNTPVMSRTGVDDPVFLTRDDARKQGLGGWQSRLAINNQIGAMARERMQGAAALDATQFKGSVDLANTQAMQTGENQRQTQKLGVVQSEGAADRQNMLARDKGLQTHQGLLQQEKIAAETESDRKKAGYLSEHTQEAGKIQEKLAGIRTSNDATYHPPTSRKITRPNPNRPGTSEEVYETVPGMIFDKNTREVTPDITTMSPETLDATKKKAKKEKDLYIQGLQ